MRNIGKIIAGSAVLLWMSAIVSAQTPITMTNGGNNSTCDATFYDIGGTGNYPAPSSNGQTVVHTICNSGTGPIWAVFTQFNLWKNSCVWGASIDKLKIYNGPSTASPLIGTFTGTDLNSAGSIIEGSSGCLTFEFIRENKGGLGCSSNPGGIGWTANITCTEPPTPETGDNCFEAVPFCSDQSYFFPNNFGNSNDAPSGPNYGCLYSQPNAIWYYLKIAQSGPIQLGLSQTNTGGSGIDIDFAMWGPFNNLSVGCNTVMGGASPLQCSYSASATETIGIGMTGGYSTGQSTPPMAQAGEYYIVVMTNYNGAQGNISLNQTAGTGSTDCSILVPCDITSLTATPSSCDDQTNTFSVTGTVEFSDQPTTGNLIIEDCNGNSVSIPAPFVSPISYTIPNIPTNGQTCEITAYFSDEPLCKKISASYTNPSNCSCVPPVLTINPINVCSATGVDLNSAIGTPSDPSTNTFYNSQADADAATNAISNLVNASGTYWVRAAKTNDPTCYSTYQITVNVTTLTYTGTTTDEICGASDGTISLTLNGGVAPITYSTNNGGTFQSSGNFTGLTSGTYNIVIKDGSGCQITGTETVGSIGGPTITQVTPQNPSCNGVCDGELAVTATGGTLPYTYTWKKNGNAVGSTDQITGLCDGTYSIEVADANNCMATQNNIVLTEPAPVFVQAPDDIVICQGLPVTLTANAPSGAQIVWDNGVTNTVPFVPANVGNTTYTVIATVGSCSATDQVDVRVISTPTPDFDANKFQGCKPLAVTFENNTTAPTGSDCTWAFGDGQTSNVCGDVTHNYLTSGTYTVTLTIKTPEGCEGKTTKLDYIHVIPSPIADFQVTPMVTSISDPEVYFVNQSKFGTQYAWYFGDESPVDTTEHPMHIYPNDEPGDYVVTLIVSSDQNCQDTMRAVIRIQDILIYYIPNTFTPDHDGFNDTFKPVFTSGFDPMMYTLTIYNRWGEVLFESHDTNIGWDGTYGGKVGLDGTYLWKVDYKETMSDKHYTKMGHVNLLR